MQFKDLLDVLDDDEQLAITVTNEYGEEYYYGTVKDFKDFKEEDLLLILRVCIVFTRVIDGFYCNKKTFGTEIEVTLCDDEHKIIFPEDEEDL